MKRGKGQERKRKRTGKEKANANNVYGKGEKGQGKERDYLWTGTAKQIGIFEVSVGLSLISPLACMQLGAEQLRGHYAQLSIGIARGRTRTKLL